MRKLFALLLALTTFCTMAYAETAFDPAQYTEEELREIDTLIHMHLSKTEEGTVLYDDNGIYIEYRGLYKCSYSRDIGINLFIQNNSGKPFLYYLATDEYVNKAYMDFRGAGIYEIHDGTMLMTKTVDQFLIRFDALKEWGVTTIQNIEFTIDFTVLVGNWRETYCTVPVSLTLDYPIV